MRDAVRDLHETVLARPRDVRRAGDQAGLYWVKARRNSVNAQESLNLPAATALRAELRIDPAELRAEVLVVAARLPLKP